MLRPLVLLFAVAIAAAPAPPVAAQQPRRTPPVRRRPPPVTAPRIPTPRSVLGFEPGDDRKLADWPTLVRYYQALASASDRMRYRELGHSTLGAPMITLVISSPQNLRALDRYRELNAKLADPRGFKTAKEAEDALRGGKTIVLITSGIHSTEVGGHLSPALLAYRLASDTSLATRAILDNVILWLVPSLNPDGVSIVTRWYNRTLGTTAEGTDPPELYHHYAGHDNNRDWYAFTQVETQLVVDSIHNVWHPQIVHDIHQQDTDGSRLFLPPYLELPESVAGPPLDRARHRDLPDRRSLRSARERGSLPRPLARELPDGRGARRPRREGLALRVRRAATASGVRRARDAAPHPASRAGRGSHRASPGGGRHSALPRRELCRGTAPAIRRVRQNAARAAALPRSPRVPGWPAAPAVRRHRPHAAAADGRDRRGSARFAAHRPLRPGRAPGRESRVSRLRWLGGATGRAVPLVCGADRRGVDAVGVRYLEGALRVGRRLGGARREAQGALRSDRPAGSVAP